MPDLFATHERTFESNRYVYPVISRRSRGVSVGINLSLDKVCNFDCVYCQVDRSEPGISREIDLALLEKELDATAALVASGSIFEHPKFAQTPDPLRRFNDIAFSGNGEPTLSRQFSDVVRIAAEIRHRHSLDDVKLVLITNATLLQETWVVAGLEILDSDNGKSGRSWTPEPRNTTGGPRDPRCHSGAFWKTSPRPPSGGRLPSKPSSCGSTARNRKTRRSTRTVHGCGRFSTPAAESSRSSFIPSPECRRRVG